MESSSLQAKKQVLLNMVLLDRKESAVKISSFLKEKLTQKINIKKFILIKKIQQFKSESVLKIQTMFRGFIIREKIQKYINKSRTCYLIKSGLNRKIKKLQMIIYFNARNRIYDFHYDDFYECFILFLERTKIQNYLYKIQFICDGRRILDPKFQTIDENGKFVNIIDFDLVIKKEIKQRQKNIKIIKECCDFLKYNNLSVVPKKKIKKYNYDDYEEKNHSDGEYDDNDYKKFKSNQSIINIALKNVDTSQNPFKMRRTFSSINRNDNIKRPKSILKMSQNKSKINMRRRVKFGGVMYFD